jgi:hypothetical protein
MKILTKISASLLLLLFFNMTIRAQEVDLVWVKQLGGAGSGAYPWALTLDGTGNIYITGLFDGTCDFNPGTGVANLTSAGKSDFFVLKLDAGGNYLWAKAIGGPGPERSYSIATDKAGNVYMTGYFSETVDFDPGPGTFNLTTIFPNGCFISKLDSNGNFIWAKQWVGDSSNSQGTSIVTDASDNVYTTGFFDGSCDFDPGAGTFIMTSTASGSSAFVSKLNTDGEFIWAKLLGGPDPVNGSAIALDADRNVYTIGYFQGTCDFNPGTAIFNLTSAGQPDCYISKLNGNGEFVWAKSIGGPGFDIPNAITVDPSGNTYVAGYFNGTVDFDPGTAVFNLTSGSSRNIFTLKLDVNGNLAWANSFQGTSTDFPKSIVLDAVGNVYSTGGFKGTTDFDPGTATSNCTANGLYDWYLSKMDASGNFIRVTHLGGTGDEAGYAMAIDASGNIYSTGYFVGTTDFDPGSSTMNLTSVGTGDSFIHKMSQDLSGIVENRNDSHFHAYPNPTNGMINISSERPLNNAQIKVLDIQGKLIENKSNLHGNHFVADISDQANGIYFIQIIETGQVSRMLVVKR